MKTLHLAAALLVLAVAGCSPAAPLATAPAAEGRTFTVLQINDVYEITPIEGGRSGGLARVAGLRQQLLADDPNTITVLAGDFLSPSALGTARVDGERLYGKQMVAVLNALGLDVAAIGNHEFDVSEEALAARIAEADFPFITANAVQPGGARFDGVPPRLVRTLPTAGGPVRVGIASVVLPSNQKDWVHYLDADSTLRAEVARLDAETDVVIGLTHQAFADDVRAAATIDGLDMVLGGHEHENVRAYRGARMVPILKADANARTVYVHRVTVGAGGAVSVASELVPITAATPEDPAVAAVVGEWVETAYAGFIADGFNPEAVAVTTTEDLDGREGTVRTRPARLGALIADGFVAASGADAGLFNGGSIRVDDVLPAGPFREYDAIRVLPFGGQVVTVALPGAVLARALDQGNANAGTGGYLQRSAEIGQAEDGAWTIGGARLDPARTYTIATNDFLVLGLETGLDFFSVEGNPEISQVGEHGDVRRALLDQLVRVYE